MKHLSAIHHTGGGINAQDIPNDDRLWASSWVVETALTSWRERSPTGATAHAHTRAGTTAVVCVVGCKKKNSDERFQKKFCIARSDDPSSYYVAQGFLS